MQDKSPIYMPDLHYDLTATKVIILNTNLLTQCNPVPLFVPACLGFACLFVFEGMGLVFWGVFVVLVGFFFEGGGCFFVWLFLITNSSLALV